MDYITERRLFESKIMDLFHNSTGASNILNRVGDSQVRRDSMDFRSSYQLERDSAAKRFEYTQKGLGYSLPEEKKNLIQRIMTTPIDPKWEKFKKDSMKDKTLWGTAKRAVFKHEDKILNRASLSLATLGLAVGGYFWSQSQDKKSLATGKYNH